MKKRSAIRNWLEYAIALAVIFSLEYSPRRAAERLARFYVALLDRALPRLRRIALRNLAMAFPEKCEAERERIASGVFGSVARLLVAFARFPHIRAANVSDWIHYEGYEHFERALACGRGVLFATAHFGNWELSAFAHALLSAPMHVVVRPLDNPLIDALVERRRALSGNHTIQKKDFARAMFKALQANQAVGILIDQNSAPEHGVFVDFFGVPACAGTGFAKIAARSGAVVIPGFALWSEQDRRYVLRFYPPVEMTGDAAADTARLQTLLESVIREYPDQWLWIHRRWKTRPPGAPPLY
ncbi:MAG TPA: lysophospholipid acyltransferase family protein [Bryobacteraceae bacterium]|nr:lysophospholipid acyltransferase family protein [Bryobacteraceae bacterium]